MRKRRDRQIVGRNSPKRFQETSNRYRSLEIRPHRALTAMTAEVLQPYALVGALDGPELVGPVG